MTGDDSQRSDRSPEGEGTDLRSALLSGKTAVEIADELFRTATADEDIDAAVTDLVAAVTGNEDVSVDERTTAAAVLATVANRRPSRAPRVVSTFQRCLDDPVTETTALRELATVAEGAPTAVDPALEAVATRLTDRPLPARESALQVFEARVDADPGALEAVTGPLVTAVASVDTDRSDADVPVHRHAQNRTENVAEERLRQRAAAVLEAVADEAPASVSPELDGLHPVLDPDVTYNTHLRERVVEVVRLVATESPEAAAELTPSLVALLQRRKLSDSLHGTVAGALATITDTRPRETAEHVQAAVEPLVGLSSHERPGVRAQATSLLSYVAQHHPDSLAPVAEQLFDRLDDDYAPVRAAAVWTIAALDTDRARKALARTASTDPDPDLRALAEELHAPDESE